MMTHKHTILFEELVHNLVDHPVAALPGEGISKMFDTYQKYRLKPDNILAKRLKRNLLSTAQMTAIDYWNHIAELEKQGIAEQSHKTKMQLSKIKFEDKDGNFDAALYFYLNKAVMDYYGVSPYSLELRLLQLWTAKSQDYGSIDDPLENLIRSSKAIGCLPLDVALLYIANKVFRLQNIRQNKHAANESLVDNLLDLISYCLIGVILLDDEQERNNL